ncbi:MAG: cation transporter [Vicinamibacterales bacterium]
MTELDLHVHGMDCAEEAALIRRALEADPGVVRMSFDLVTGRVSVTFDPARTSAAAVTEAVARTGLAAHAHHDHGHGGDAGHDHEHGHTHGATARWTVVAGGFFAAAWIYEGLQADTWLEALVGHHDGGLAHAHDPVAIGLYVLSLAAGLGPLLPRAAVALRFLRLDMHVLVCLSAIGAAAIGQWAEAASVAFLFSLAHRMEAWSLERARAAIDSATAASHAPAVTAHDNAPVERWIERFAAVYTPAVTLAAITLAVVVPLWEGNWAVWFYRGLVFLVLACPCALVISTPVTVVAALTSAARHGVLVHGGGALERAARGLAAARHTIEVGDAVLLPEGTGSAEFLARHARRALGVIRENVGLALLTKLAFLVSAVFGVAPLWLAVLADTGATVLVTLNGLRLLRVR